MAQCNNCQHDTAVTSEVDPEFGHYFKYCLLCEHVEEVNGGTHPAEPVKI
jgi:transcription elongation factor Elf1